MTNDFNLLEITENHYSNYCTLLMYSKFRFSEISLVVLHLCRSNLWLFSICSPESSFSFLTMHQDIMLCKISKWKGNQNLIWVTESHNYVNELNDMCNPGLNNMKGRTQKKNVIGSWWGDWILHWSEEQDEINLNILCSLKNEIININKYSFNNFNILHLINSFILPHNFIY